MVTDNEEAGMGPVLPKDMTTTHVVVKGHTLAVERLTFLIIVVIPVCFFQSPQLTERTKHINPGEAYNLLFILPVRPN